MFCNACGSNIEPDAQVCGVCGTVVNVDTTPDMSPAVQQSEVKVTQKAQVPDLRTLQGDELCRYLVPLLQPLKQIDTIEENIDTATLRAQSIRAHGVWHYFWPFFAFGWLLSTIVSSICVSVLEGIGLASGAGAASAVGVATATSANYSSMNYTVILWFIVAFLIYAGGLTLAILMRNRSVSKMNANKEAIQKDIYAMRNRQDELYMSVSNVLEKVPQDYRYYIAVNYIVDCLQKGRADSMKEAINLYEEQLHRWKLENAAMEAVVLQQQQAASLRSIQASSRVAAVASTANAIHNILS